MAFYGFTDLPDTHTYQFLAADGLVWGTHSLEEEVEGLHILAAEGRDDFKREVTSLTRLGDGDIFQRSRVSSREITINWWLRAETEEDFEESMRIFKSSIQGDEVEFSFNDEPNFYLRGTVTEFVLDTPGSYMPKGHFVITLSDPFKYAFAKDFSSVNSTVIPDQELIYPSRINHITTGSIGGGSKIEFEHYRDGVLKHWVTFDNPQTGVQKVDFDTKTVTSNNQPWNTHLLFSSNFSSWNILQWDEVKVWLTDSTGRHEINYTMTYEVRYL